MSLRSLFVTEIYQDALKMKGGTDAFLAELDDACRAIADEDDAGHDWCAQKAYHGYTSYGSLNDLTTRSPTFGALARELDRHARAFCEQIEFDVGPKDLKLDNIWINILEPMGHHSNHIHPLSVLSGTVYVSIPEDAACLRFEDPRLDRFMNAPKRKASAQETRQTFIDIKPEEGMVLFWESWLRHEVLTNRSDSERISVSFNYNWA